MKNHNLSSFLANLALPKFSKQKVKAFCEYDGCSVASEKLVAIWSGKTDSTANSKTTITSKKNRQASAKWNAFSSACDFVEDILAIYTNYII